MVYEWPDMNRLVCVCAPTLRPRRRKRQWNLPDECWSDRFLQTSLVSCSVWVTSARRPLKFRFRRLKGKTETSHFKLFCTAVNTLLINLLKDLFVFLYLQSHSSSHFKNIPVNLRQNTRTNVLLSVDLIDSYIVINVFIIILFSFKQHLIFLVDFKIFSLFYFTLCCFFFVFEQIWDSKAICTAYLE